jgi:hypothetical protein
MLSKAWRLCVSSDFRSGVTDVFALLGHCAALIGGSLPTFRYSLSVIFLRLLDCMTLEDGTERSGTKYQLKVRNVPEERELRIR